MMSPSHGRMLHIDTLDANGEYQTRETSLSFPDLPPSQVAQFLAQLGTASETALVRAFRQQWAVSVTNP
jgi:hypothetical protein